MKIKDAKADRIARLSIRMRRLVSHLPKETREAVEAIVERYVHACRANSTRSADLNQIYDEAIELVQLHLDSTDETSVNDDVGPSRHYDQYDSPAGEEFWSGERI